MDNTHTKKIVLFARCKVMVIGDQPTTTDVGGSLEDSEREREREGLLSRWVWVAYCFAPNRLRQLPRGMYCTVR